MLSRQNATVDVPTFCIPSASTCDTHKMRKSLNMAETAHLFDDDAVGQAKHMLKV